VSPLGRAFKFRRRPSLSSLSLLSRSHEPVYPNSADVLDKRPLHEVAASPIAETIGV